jgi:hypothetical protein
MSGTIKARERRAAKAVAGLSQGNRFDDWVAIGEGLLAGREWAMQKAGVATPYGQHYNAELTDWRARNAWSQDPRLKHPTGVNAIWVVENLVAIEAWRRSLSDDERDGYNHPSTIRREFAKAQKGGGSGRAPSPSGNRSRIADLEAQLKQAQDMVAALRQAFDQVAAENAALQQELTALKAAGAGLNGYSRFPLLGFDPPFTVKQITSRYRQLAKVYHVDAGGADQQMTLLNAERDKALKEATEPGGKGVSSP